MISSLERVLREVDDERSRQELRGLLGKFKVEADEREIGVYNEQGRVEAALLKCIGADARNCGSGGVLPIQAVPLLRTVAIFLLMPGALCPPFRSGKKVGTINAASPAEFVRNHWQVGLEHAPETACASP